MYKTIQSFLLLALACTYTTQASYYNEVPIRSLSKDATSHQLLSRDHSQAWLVAIDQKIATSSPGTTEKTPHLVIVNLKRGASFFGDAGLRAALPLRTLVANTEATRFKLISTSKTMEGGFALVLSACEDQTCENTAQWILKITTSGEIDETFGTQKWRPSECPLPPLAIHPHSTGYWIANGCGEIENRDSDFSPPTSEPIALVNMGEHTPQRGAFLTIPDSDELLYHSTLETNESSSSYLTKLNAQGQNKTTFGQNGALINVISMTSSCAVATSTDTIYTLCTQTDNEGDTAKYTLTLQHWTLDGQLRTGSLPKWGEATEAIEQAQLHHIDGHLFAAEQYAQGVRLSNRTLNGVRYSEKVILGAPLPEGARNNTSARNDIYVATVAATEETTSPFTLGVYDFTDQDQPPYFNIGGSGTLLSGQAYDFTLDVSDEDTLFDDLVVTYTALPNWLSYDNETRRFEGTPYHDMVGNESFTITVTDNSEQTAELTLDLNIILSQGQLLFFEQTLFERLALESPVPLKNLMDSLPKIQILEDTPFQGVLSLFNRAEGELRLAIDGLPSWLHYEPENNTLSGIPLQAHVGVSQPVTFTVTDVFASPGDPEANTPATEPVIITVLFDVIEVDERFHVTSNGEATLTRGEKYHYQITVIDEESTLPDFRVTAHNIPDWLSYNETAHSISGTATKDTPLGKHLVQLTLTDEGGYGAVHAFYVTVLEDPNAIPEKSAGSIHWTFLITGLILLAGRRKRKTR